MSKIITAIYLLLISSQTFGNEPYKLEKVIQADSLNKEIIYTIVSNWIATNYNSANDVIQLSDKESGSIICKATMKFGMGKLSYSCYDGYVDYTLSIYIKDGRYKVVLSNVIHENLPKNAPQCNLGLISDAENYTDKGMSKNYHNAVWNDIKNRSNVLFDEICDGLNEAIAKGSSELLKDDW